jgi:hypothetical protein
MTDGLDRLDKLIERVEASVRHHGRAAYIVAAALAALLLWWLLRADADRHEVGDKIREIKTTADVAERRADAIVDAGRAREEAARDETRTQVQAVSDDGLPDILAGLLRDWRESK